MATIIDQLRAEIERLETDAAKRMQEALDTTDINAGMASGGVGWACEQLLSFLDTLQEQSCETCTNDKGCVTCKDGELWEGKEEPSEDLEEAVEQQIEDFAGCVPSDDCKVDSTYLDRISWIKEKFRYFYNLGKRKVEYLYSKRPSELDEAARAYTGGSISDEAAFEVAAFKAGAEWQKEQDQPITGNSLEQEWLRYVDRKKKENRGELPALGDYGWLQIARHFAKWQKSQMPMPEDAVLFNKGVAEGRRLERQDMLKDAVVAYVNIYENVPGGSYVELVADISAAHFKKKEGVKILILRED